MSTQPDRTWPLDASLRGYLLERLESFCALSSPSGDSAGVERMARAYGQELEALGLEVRLEPHTSGPVLVAHAPKAQPPYLLVVGHLDTVLPARPVQRSAGRLCGSGAVDMKGGLVAFLGALHLLKGRGQALPPNLAVVLVPDEETSGTASQQAMASWGPHAAAVLVVEPGEQEGPRETLVLGRKGMAEFRVAFRGASAHSGLAFHRGRSALLAAARFAQQASQLSRGLTTVNLARLVAGDRGFVEDLARQASLLGTSERLNVVPDTAILQGEFRFAEEVEGKHTAEALAQFAQAVGQETGVGVELTLGSWVPPVEARAGLWLAELAQELARSMGLDLEVETCRGGISLPNFLNRPDLPVLDGLGPVGGGMHTEEEYVELGSLERRVALLAALLRALPAALHARLEKTS